MRCRCCGSGLFSLLATKHFSHVYGVEISAAAVQEAQADAVLNCITNATFLAGEGKCGFWSSVGIAQGVRVKVCVNLS